MVHVIRVKLKIDDSLDVFAVHGVGGMLGILLLPFLSAEVLGGTGDGDFMTQLTGTVAVVATLSFHKLQSTPLACFFIGRKRISTYVRLDEIGIFPY